jgi:hypothetical protein
MSLQAKGPEVAHLNEIIEKEGRSAQQPEQDPTKPDNVPLGVSNANARLARQYRDERLQGDAEWLDEEKEGSVASRPSHAVHGERMLECGESEGNKNDCRFSEEGGRREPEGCREGSAGMGKDATEGLMPSREKKSA